MIIFLRILSCVLSPAIVVGLVLFNSSSDEMRIFMNGKLSGSHSFLEYDCGSCHIPWKNINNESCTSCHEDDEHYVEEESSEPVKRVPEKIARCFDCHLEHRGKSHDMNVVEYTPI
jgi:hypothetical protein